MIENDAPLGTSNGGHDAAEHGSAEHDPSQNRATPAPHAHDEEKIRRTEQLLDGSGTATSPDSDKDVASGGPADPTP